MNDKTIKIALAYSLGSDLHEAWRAPRKLENGTYEPRMKKTKDEEWTKKHGKEEVDIANCTFSELPYDWQKENLSAALVVIGLVYDKIIAGKTITPEEIEKMAAIVHEEWLKRNTYVYGPVDKGGRPDLTVPYADLEDVEKEKDRVQIAPAIKKVQEYMNGLIDIESICDEYQINKGFTK